VISGTPTGAAGTFTQATISVAAGGQSRGQMKLNLVVASPGSDLAPVNLSTRGREKQENDCNDSPPGSFTYNVGKLATGGRNVGKRPILGEFEQLVLLAVVRLGDGAYAVPIRSEIARRTAMPVSRGAVYVTLDRLARTSHAHLGPVGAKLRFTRIRRAFLDRLRIAPRRAGDAHLLPAAPPWGRFCPYYVPHGEDDPTYC